MQVAATTTNYYQNRMSALGISDKVNTTTVEYTCFDDNVLRQTSIFTENERGGIDILYIGLSGLKTYLKNGKAEMPYVRTRLHPDYERAGLPKYLTPKGASTQVFIPPLVLRAYEDRRTIETLIVTEGEFKAFKASLHGLHCVGTQGIHNTHEKDEHGNNVLNTELEQIIKACAVKNVVLLFDNDCLSVDYTEEKDLFKRPNSFYTAVKNFREYTKHLKCDVYFSHLKTDLETKGIDNLLCSKIGSEHQVVDDLLAINRQNSQYFVIQNVTIALPLRNV